MTITTISLRDCSTTLSRQIDDIITKQNVSSTTTQTWDM